MNPMGITLAYNSALHVLRLLRAKGKDVKGMDRTTISRPVPWVGKRWSVADFLPSQWSWQSVNAHDPLHIMVADPSDRVWLRGVKSHVCTRDLPPGSIVWVDEHTSMVSPPLLFLQMARYMSLPSLVMLGYELCGHYSRNAADPSNGPITDGLRAAMSVEELTKYLQSAKSGWRLQQARKAAGYVQDHAVSIMEGLLSTIYSLPVKDLGYGMGPVTLNERVSLGGEEHGRSRYPDIMFSFAPIGINYDGSDHLDLDGLIACATQAERADEDHRMEAQLDLEDKREAVRAKVVDDAARNRQLAACGRIVFPATKENVFTEGALDKFTREMLDCAHAIFGADVTQYKKSLNDTEVCNERFELLSSLMSFESAECN